MKLWRQHCASLVKKIYHGQLLEGPLEVVTTFFIYPPEYIQKLKYAKESLDNEMIWSYTRPDLDNYVKAVYDSISDSGVVWKDDGQVAKMSSEKRYSLNPRIEVEIKPLEDVRTRRKQ